jgi:AbrB family looped-hinge helix DNA binding protein
VAQTVARATGSQIRDQLTRADTDVDRTRQAQARDAAQQALPDGTGGLVKLYGCQPSRRGHAVSHPRAPAAAPWLGVQSGQDGGDELGPDASVEADSAPSRLPKAYGRISPIPSPIPRPRRRTMTSSTTVTLDSTGRIVLPSEVRKRLRLEAGARFSVEVVAERIELTPEAAPEAAVVRKAGRLVLAAIGEPLDAGAAIRAERQTQAGRARRR